MDHELEYFTEFLDDPSAPSIAEFYRMARLWCDYLAAHKADFNYLEDDEWKEIRERFIAEMRIREEIKDKIDIEWDEIEEDGENIEELGDDEALALIKRKLNFMKLHQDFYQFKEDEIATFEFHANKFEKSLENSKIAEENLRISKIAYEKSLGDLEETLFKVYERTGKIPFIHTYKGAKRYKGN
ncbi:hypothetical protein BH10ACI1_BH10ACI1_20810 [soil metagenome]